MIELILAGAMIVLMAVSLGLLGVSAFYVGAAKVLVVVLFVCIVLAVVLDGRVRRRSV